MYKEHLPIILERGSGSIIEKERQSSRPMIFFKTLENLRMNFWRGEIINNWHEKRDDGIKNFQMGEHHNHYFLFE